MKLPVHLTFTCSRMITLMMLVKLDRQVYHQFLIEKHESKHEHQAMLIIVENVPTVLKVVKHIHAYRALSKRM